MSNTIHDDKFKEELEKELQSGLESEQTKADDDDFTVKVKREEYIVKRRFYDKDKALETAETLRKDKRNLVEDNLEGQAIASDMDEDEHIDWDKLVDSGLQFDPPIAQAADIKPGDKPVGLAKHSPTPLVDDKELERTLVVKQPKRPPEPENPVDEMVEFEGEEVQAEPTKKSTLKRGILLILLVVCALGAGYYLLTSSTDSSKPVVDVTRTPIKKSITTPEPAASIKPNVPAAPAETPAKAPFITEDTMPEKSDLPAPKTEMQKPVDLEKPQNTVAESSPAPEITKPEPLVPATIAHYTHTVHVSSYQSIDRAVAAVDQLTNKGFQAFTGAISIPGKGVWYRVYAGYLQDFDTAVTLSQRIKKELREDAVVRKTPLAIQVGKFAKKDAIDDLLSRLDQKKYSVNVIPLSHDSPMVRILTGAFKTEKEAAAMLSMIKNHGFSAKIVQR